MHNVMAAMPNIGVPLVFLFGSVRQIKLAIC